MEPCSTAGSGHALVVSTAAGRTRDRRGGTVVSWTGARKPCSGLLARLGQRARPSPWRRCAASRSCSSSIPRTTHRAARRRRAGSGTRKGVPARRARRCSASASSTSSRRRSSRRSTTFRSRCSPTPGTRLRSTYGVWVEKKTTARPTWGLQRSTFVIDADGTIAKIFRNVKPEEHAEQVLAALS